MKEVYKIWCEWDVGFESNIYATEELAQKDIDKYDWSMCGCTLKGAQEDGFVSIETLNFIEG